ncbi:MAG: hypothetical protein M1457_09115, partial [bacterium]|nr:hypothetical protein [bacterium]
PLDAQDGTTLTLWRAEREAGLSRPAGGRGAFRMELPAPPILPGRYTLTISLSPPGRPSDHYDCLYRLFAFTIEPEPDWPTVAPLELRPRVET